MASFDGLLPILVACYMFTVSSALFVNVKLECLAKPNDGPDGHVMAMTATNHDSDGHSNVTVIVMFCGRHHLWPSLLWPSLLNPLWSIRSEFDERSPSTVTMSV